MEEIKKIYDWYLNLNPSKKTHLFYTLIITGLVYLNYRNNLEYKKRNDELHNDYVVLGNRYNRLFDTSQESINHLNKEKQEIVEKYSDKFEILFRESQQIKKKVE